MTSNEVRKDYLLNRWVVIATNRNKRPTDFVKKQESKQDGICPLCPGNEHLTPPAVLVYLLADGEIVKEKEQNDLRLKDWVLRVVPNLFPVFVVPKQDDVIIKKGPQLANAVGHHEVIVETPCHDEHPAVARVSQLVHTVNAYVDRIKALSSKPYVKHVALFKNYGMDSGASLSHTHSQLITTPFLPTTLEEELKASKQFWNKNGECIFCDIIKKERSGPRFIWENQSFVVFAPYASVNPMEFWVFPKRHQSNMANMSDNEIKDLAETLRVCLGALKTLLNNPSYNFGFHTLLQKDAQDCYHWHLEVYPKVLTWAGFEKSTGMYINMVLPEDAASELGVAVNAELEALQK
ncbi:MAG: DUF4921 family protein [Candidatus Bathyarchaeota archaeon]|nr:DUF4921 family protein [Candidatus Bathyarchaeota archaeon]